MLFARPSRSSRRSGLALVALTFGALGACASDDAMTTGGSCENPRVVVATSDTSAAGFAFVRDGARTVVPRFGTDLGKDPLIARSGGRCFFVARDVGNVFELDACGAPIARFDVGTDRPGSENPQDVAVAGDGALWVPLFDVPRIAVTGRASGETTFLDLASFDDDGNPQASAIVRVATPAGAKMYVALERLDDTAKLASTRPSFLVRFDEATRAPEKTFPLVAKNPFNRIVEAFGSLFLTSPGRFDLDDEEVAGIERFDLATETSTLFASERDLGGSATELVFEGNCGAAIIAAGGAKNETSLVSFDVKGGVFGSAKAPPLTTDDYDLVGLAVSGGRLYVGDQRRESDGFRLRAYGFAPSCELIPTPSSDVFLTQQPVSMSAPW